MVYDPEYLDQPEPAEPDRPETVEGRMEGLLSKNNKYMMQARTGALQTAEQRGLLNTSIAATAGEKAAIETVLPIAQQDAAQAHTRGMQEAGFGQETEQERLNREQETGERRGAEAAQTAETILTGGQQAARLASTLTSEESRASKELSSEEKRASTVATATRQAAAVRALGVVQNAIVNYAAKLGYSFNLNAIPFI